MTNPLLQSFNTKYQSAPFAEIKEEHYLPAFKELIDQSLQEIQEITQNPETPTFENTIEALAYSGEQLDVVSNIFFNLNSADTNDEIQQIAQEVSPLLTEFASKISQNEQLFSRIKKVYDEKDHYTLNEEQKMLLEETYKGFVRNGALLNDEKKEQLKNINIELSKKSLQFGQNVLAATNQYYKHLTNKEDLAGIPEAILAQYEEEAKERNLEGYVITLQFPSLLPVLTYAENRELRKELAIANGKKSFDGGEFDNQNLIKELVQLRQEKAQLLGYKSFADYVLEERMAKSPQKVLEFLNELLTKAKPFILVARRNNGTFRIRFVIQSGIPFPYKPFVQAFTRIAIPEKPPVTIPAASKQEVIAVPISPVPTIIRRYSRYQGFFPAIFISTPFSVAISQ